MELRKPTANTSQKYMCMSFHGNGGRLLAGKVCLFRHLHRLRSDSLRSLTVTSALCSFLLYHRFPMSFFEVTQIYHPFFRASPFFGLVPGRESVVLSALPLLLVSTDGMDPARVGLVSWDVGKLRCVSAFKMTSF